MNTTPLEPQSPFAPPPHEAPEAPNRPESPFAHDPEPRPRIIHLMAWTGCTAAFLGVQQLLLNGMYGPFHSGSGAFAIQRVAFGIGAGIALASLGMLAVRRSRGIPFPIHPGEFLLVLHGLSVVATFVAWGGILLLFGFQDSRLTMLAVFLPYLVVTAIAAIWAVMRIPLRRWRAFFVIFVLAIVVKYGLPLISPVIWMFGWLPVRLIYSAIQLAIPVVLAFAVWRDKRARERRPWTHWLGIGLEVWLWLTDWILPLLYRLT